MKLFSKFKNQNDDLEAILINKTFSTFIKNLLLSMTYKIESSYNDYSEVKQINKTSKEVIYEVNDTIEKYCDFIQLADPNDITLEKNKVLGLTNLQERSIFSYPTEAALLYSILSIKPKYYFIKDNYIFKNLIQSALVDGYISNTLEIIQDFNGWTWENSPKANTPFINHLIYQNLIDICGEEYMTNWRNDSTPKTDYINGIKKKIEQIDPYNEYFITLEKLLYVVAPSVVQMSYSPKLIQLAREYKAMQNKTEYLSTIKAQVQSINKEINKINLLLNSPRLLNIDFQKNMRMVQVNDINKYSRLLINKRNNCANQAANLMKLQNPIEYSKYKLYLEEATSIYQTKESKEELLTKLELEYIKLMNEKIKTITTNEDLTKYIYKIRYFKKINISSKKRIENNSKLNKEIDKIFFNIITRACENGLLKIFSMDKDYNFDIYKIIFDTRIIDLNETKVKLSIENKEKLIINIYDKEAFETKIQIDYNKAKHNLQVRTNKYIRIFI